MCNLFKNGSLINHNCNTCISGYSFLEGSLNCETDNQDNTGYYKDGDTWKKCYVFYIKHTQALV